MGIGWTQAQRRRVQATLDRHPIESGRCEQAAAEIRPIAMEVDGEAKIWRLSPADGRYVVPKVKLETPWFFHVTVDASAHFVDVLTGADGAARETYLETHWNYSDAIAWEEEVP